MPLGTCMGTRRVHTSLWTPHSIRYGFKTDGILRTSAHRCPIGPQLTVLRSQRIAAASSNGSNPLGNLPSIARDPGAPGLLFGVGEPGAWDDAAIGHPVVRYYLGDNEQRWFMWYSGRSTQCIDVDDLFPSSGSIGLAVSTDGITWSRGYGSIEGVRGEGRAKDVGRTLAPNTDWWWHDTMHIHVSDVQILSSGAVGGGTGVYWCFYSGGNFEQVEVPVGMSSTDAAALEATTPQREGFRLRPGLAMSQDGRNFARIEADHHTGALFDVGEEGEWDAAFIGAPQVVAVGPRDLRLYYHSFDVRQEKYVVGLATSADGFKWTKKGPIFSGSSIITDFDGKGVASRCVVRDVDSKKYFMFYEAVAADNSRSIGLAVSEDGMGNWQRHPMPVLMANSEADAWDGGSVGTPWAVSMAQGKWRLYYSGRHSRRGGAWQGIGLALSDASPDGLPTAFKRREMQATR